MQQQHIARDRGGARAAGTRRCAAAARLRAGGAVCAGCVAGMARGARASCCADGCSRATSRGLAPCLTCRQQLVLMSNSHTSFSRPLPLLPPNTTSMSFHRPSQGQCQHAMVWSDRAQGSCSGRCSCCCCWWWLPACAGGAGPTAGGRGTTRCQLQLLGSLLLGSLQLLLPLLPLPTPCGSRSLCRSLWRLLPSQPPNTYTLPPAVSAAAAGWPLGLGAWEGSVDRSATAAGGPSSGRLPLLLHRRTASRCAMGFRPACA
jgi:hypothetical protein